MIRAVHHHPRVCFALHYFGPDFDVDLCNAQADMVIVNPTFGKSSQLAQLTCEKWAYCALNVTGPARDGAVAGYNWELYRLACEHNCLLCDTSGEPVNAGSAEAPMHVIDPRRMDVWPDIAIACLQDYMALAPPGTWDGIFIDCGWRDCWPLNLTNLDQDTKDELNSCWPAFMREAGIKLARKVKLPIIGNGNWQDFIGRHRMVGKMFENAPYKDQWWWSGSGPLRGEGFLVEGLRDWSYDKRMILMPRHMEFLQDALALAMLFDLWICPPCGSGAVCEVTESKAWYATQPARFDHSGAWERALINHEQHERGRVRATFQMDDLWIEALPWGIDE